jgi:hypothetical protein
VLIGLAILAALVTWLLSRHAPEERVAAAPATARHAPAVVEAERARPQQSTGAAIRTAAPVVCPDQSIEIAIGRQPPRTSCLGQTRTILNGSVRTYRMETRDLGAPSLNIDAGGGAILRAELLYPDGRKFSCRGDKCARISMGPHDAQGARSIQFKGAKLSRSEQTAVVNGTFGTVPDDQVASTTCVGQLLYISVGEGTVHFCPDTGSGFQRDRDGSTAYKFRNGDGNTVSVRLSREGALQSVEYRSFICHSPNCAGVSVSPAAAGERRNFVFQGTVLTGQGAGATTAILNGNLVLAPQ